MNVFEMIVEKLLDTATEKQDDDKRKEAILIDGEEVRV